MATEWFVRRGEQSLGPFTSAQLREFAAAGKITPQSNVRMGTTGSWVPAARIARLFDGVATPPAQPSPALTSHAPPPVAQAIAPPAVPPPAPPPIAQTAAAAASSSLAGVWLGLAALVLGLIASIVFFLPLVGILLGIIGFIVGIAGAAVAAIRNGRGLSLSISGSTISALAILGAVGWWYLAAQFINAKSLLTEVTQPVIPVRPQPAPTPVLPQAPPKPAAPAPPPPELPWTEYGKAAKLGELELSIASAAISQVTTTDILGNRLRSREKQLAVKLVVKNTSAALKIDYPGFGSQALLQGAAGLLGGNAGAVTSGAPTLNDDAGNHYKQMSAASEINLLSGNVRSIYPGTETTELLVFERPVPGSKMLHLELPGGAIGQPGSARLEIPASVITGLQ